MNRLLFLPVAAALLAGCYGAPPPPVPCAFPALNVYWTPGPAVQNGFTVPGLAAAGLPPFLGCAAAGVDGVQVTIGGQLVLCPVGSGHCVDGNTWRCSTGGVGFDLPAGGSYGVRIDAYGGADLRYTSSASVSASGCGDTFYEASPQGVAGPLDLSYAFGDGGNLCASPSSLWFLVRRGSASGPEYDYVDERTPLGSQVACTDVARDRFISVLDPVAGANVPAGVYTRTRMEEVSLQGAAWVPQRADCSTYTVVHAGPDVIPASLVASGALCP